MRRVLFILYYFPPSGGPGVQRGLKFIRYLPEFGWQPVVLTVREDAAFPVRDASLMQELPEGLIVRRSYCPELYGAYRALTGRRATQSLDITSQSRAEGGLRRRLMRWIRGTFFIPDGRMGWLPFGIRQGTRMIRDYDCQLLFSSGPPFTTHLIARGLHRRTALPWVADYRDPWTQATFYPSRPMIARRIDLALESSCIREAERNIVVGQTMVDEFRRRYGELDPERFVIIPNGFDPADFRGIPHAPPDQLRITHSGSLFGNRIPELFLQIVEELIEQEEGFADGVHLCFAGRLDDDMRARLRRPPLDRVAELPGYLPHRESIRLLRRSSLLLLLIGRDAQARSMVTGKLFEYLASGVPILTLGPHDGDAARLVERTQAGWVFDHEDGEGLRKHLLNLWRTYRDRDTAARSRAAKTDATEPAALFGLHPDPTEINRYDRREQARQLARLFDASA